MAAIRVLDPESFSVVAHLESESFRPAADMAIDVICVGVLRCIAETLFECEENLSAKVKV